MIILISRKQACKCCPAQGTKSVGRTAVRHEIWCFTTAGDVSTHSASGATLANVREVNTISSCNICQPTSSCATGTSRFRKSLPRRNDWWPVAICWTEFGQFPAAIHPARANVEFGRRCDSRSSSCRGCSSRCTPGSISWNFPSGFRRQIRTWIRFILGGLLTITT